jgi:hypothetical protein
MVNAGYCERLNTFTTADNITVVENLKTFIRDAGDSQVRAWRESIHILKSAVAELISKYPHVDKNSSIILEYTIPLESRRIDAVLLLNGVVLIIEFKGKARPSQADIDQAAAYARDLRAYHKECSQVPVKCLLVLVGKTGGFEHVGDLAVIGPAHLSSYCGEALRSDDIAPNALKFLLLQSYHPLPSLIKAARELFKSGTLTRIHRAATATEPTLAECSAIIHETAKKKRRALILICGVPGAGKTLVGLQLAHAKYLDDLAVARSEGGKPTAPGVFLSGNGPLVEVLQYELRSAGGDGKAFVRGVHEYVKTFTKAANLVPPQHVLIYDEAQRAFDADQVQAKHRDMPRDFQGLSEPELFIRFAERVPEWCVVVGLIGAGQEIHIGEEGGLGQWRTAIEEAGTPDNWDIYIPINGEVKAHFGRASNVSCREVLELSTTIRFHLATKLYDFVKHLLDGQADNAKGISVELEKNGYNLRLTHDLENAKKYLANRYDRNPDARFGILASAKDKALSDYGIPKGFKNPGEVGPGKYGKWYSEPLGINGSCTGLNTVATEFGAQGLELDACLLAWGTDFIRENGTWSNRFASGYREANRVVDAKTLRMNAYRVLLTRGRDGCIVFIPPIPDKMRETYTYLRYCGFTELEK